MSPTRFAVPARVAPVTHPHAYRTTAPRPSSWNSNYPQNTLPQHRPAATPPANRPPTQFRPVMSPPVQRPAAIHTVTPVVPRATPIPHAFNVQSGWNTNAAAARGAESRNMARPTPVRPFAAPQVQQFSRPAPPPVQHYNRPAPPPPVQHYNRPAPPPPAQHYSRPAPPPPAPRPNPQHQREEHH
jgi:hypothetical protein